MAMAQRGGRQLSGGGQDDEPGQETTANITQPAEAQSTTQHLQGNLELDPYNDDQVRLYIYIQSIFVPQNDNA